MRIVRKILPLIFVITLLLLVGCQSTEIGTNKTVKAYGLINKSFIGEIIIQTDKSGKVVNIDIEEYYMPTTLFKASNYGNDKFGSDQLQNVVTSNGAEFEYIKNVSMNDEQFELFVSEYKDDDNKSFEPKRYTVDYRSKRKISLNTYISTDEGGEAYVKSLKSGNVTVGIYVNEHYQTVSEANYNGGINKSCTGYWAAELGETKGWALNMQLIKTQLIKECNKNEINKPDKAALNRMQVDSGATIEGFAEYVELAFKAYKKLTSK